MISLDVLLNEVPDKSVYKSTATNKLKAEIHNMIVENDHKCV